MCEPVVQVREKGHKDKGIHSYVAKSAVERILLWRVRTVEAAVSLIRVTAIQKHFGCNLLLLFLLSFLLLLLR